MNNLEKVVRLSSIAKMLFNNYIEFKNAEIRKFQNEEHVMTGDSEIIIPSKQELYIFEKNFWNLSIEDNYIVLSKKEIRKDA